MSLSSDRPSLESSLTNQAVAAAEDARQLGAAGDRTSSVAEGGAVRESTPVSCWAIPERGGS